MRLMIVDDEPLARDRLRRLVSELADMEVVGEAASGPEALALCTEVQPDLLLLDIRMPGMDGMAVAKQLTLLPEPVPAVIFTTAYGDHAVEAFEAEAVDYLVKPIRRERLEQAIARAARRRPAVAEPSHRRTHLTYSQHGRVQIIPVEEVLWLHAEDKYVVARHPGGEALLEDSLKSLEEAFPERFLRIHRNALVAREALQGMVRSAAGSYRAELADGSRDLEISRRHVADVRRFLKERAGG